MCQSHRKQNVRVSNVTITQKQNVLVTSVIITQKTECRLPTLQSHRKQSVLVTRVIITHRKQNVLVTSATITQKIECTSYQLNNDTENRLRYLQRKGNDQRNDRTEKRICELPR